MERAYPARILVIRHGEKPDDPKNPHLSAVGEMRAAMLAKKLPTLYPHIDALFATALSRDSNRPFETIKPLSKVLGLPIDTSFKAKQHAELAAKINGKPKLYAGKTVLICWHHEMIPALVHDDLRQASAPTKWPGENVFNQIWQIDYASDGQSTFSIRTEPAMPDG